MTVRKCIIAILSFSLSFFLSFFLHTDTARRRELRSKWNLYHFHPAPITLPNLMWNIKTASDCICRQLWKQIYWFSQRDLISCKKCHIIQSISMTFLLSLHLAVRFTCFSKWECGKSYTNKWKYSVCVLCSRNYVRASSKCSSSLRNDKNNGGLYILYITHTHTYVYIHLHHWKLHSIWHNLII